MPSVGKNLEQEEEEEEREERTQLGKPEQEDLQLVDTVGPSSGWQLMSFPIDELSGTFRH